MNEPIAIRAGSQIHQAVMKAASSSSEVVLAAQSFLEGRELDPEQWQLEIAIRLLPPSVQLTQAESVR